MARVGGGHIIKVTGVDEGVANCLWFDSRGQLHDREYDVRSLEPFWLASSPKSIWPEINELPDAVVRQMDELAAARRREKARKPKPSNKIKQRGQLRRRL